MFQISQGSFYQTQELRVINRLVENNVHFVHFEDWKLIDNVEKYVGQEKSKPREKLTTVHHMIQVIKEEKLG